MITQFKIFEANEILPEVGDWVALNPEFIGKTQMRGLIEREPAEIIRKRPLKSGGFRFTIEFEKKRGKEQGWRKSFPAGGTFAYLKTWVLYWSKNKEEVEDFLRINPEIDKYNL